MRKIIICMLIALCCALFAVPAFAQDRHIRRTHFINIEVECLDAAIEIIRGLEGYNLESFVFVSPPQRRGQTRHANFTRRVGEWAFTHVQAELRNVGVVLEESEYVVALGAQLMNIEARLAAVSQEIDRLTSMLNASENLDVLMVIDFRLSQVIWERNSLRGQQNVLLSQAASPVIHISLWEIAAETPEDTPPGFGSRIATSFGNSLQGTLSAAASLLVFVVRISLPALIFCVLLAIVLIITLRKVKRHRRLQAAAAPAGGGAIITGEIEGASTEAIDPDNLNEEGMQ